MQSLPSSNERNSQQVEANNYISVEDRFKAGKEDSHGGFLSFGQNSREMVEIKSSGADGFDFRNVLTIGNSNVSIESVGRSSKNTNRSSSR